MYAPKGKMGLTLKFTSQEGHFGTMVMSGGMARGLEESRHFWIVERQSVPGFLAQVTTEMFEKTTVSHFSSLPHFVSAFALGSDHWGIECNREGRRSWTGRND